MALDFAGLEKLPDDVKVELADGTTITLGEIRNAATEHVNKRIADLTPREQKLVTREQALQEAEERVRQTMAQLANIPTPPATPPAPTPGTPPPPLGYTQEQWNAIMSDPYARPMMSTMALLAEKTEKLEKLLAERDLSDKQRADTQQQLEETRWINYQLDTLADKTDPRYKDPNERKALLEFAQDSIKRRDMTVIHKARTYDDAVKAAGEAGYQRGLAEGKVAAPVPSVVHGTRVVPTTPQPDKLPKTFAEFSDAAANDPSLVNEIREAASQQPQQ